MHKISICQTVTRGVGFELMQQTAMPSHLHSYFGRLYSRVLEKNNTLIVLNLAAFFIRS